jgi:uncharacterized phage-associated protein
MNDPAYFQALGGNGVDHDVVLSPDRRFGGTFLLTAQRGGRGHSVFDPAEYLLRALKGTAPMKLHKLLYYAQAWSLVWEEKPLFQERIEAWASGPVIPELYRAHQGKYKIETVYGDPDALSENEKETLDVIVKDYGCLSSQQLSDLIHSEAPWREAREGIPGNERGGNAITLDVLQEYYGNLPPG